MEVKNLFDPKVKQEIIDCINKLISQTQRLWDKMDGHKCWHTARCRQV